MSVGTLVLPDPANVRYGISYGADGTEFTGTLGAFTGGGSLGGDIEAVLLSVLQQQAFDGISGADVVARKLPRVSEQLAPQPPCCILAAGSQAEEWEPISTEGQADYLYFWEVAFVKAGNLDMSADDQVRTWVQQARNAVSGDAGRQAVRAAAPSVWWLEIRPGALFDRGTLAQGYSYSGFTVVVHSCEAR